LTPKTRLALPFARAAVACVLLWSPAAFAQAWLPSARTLGYSLAYTDIFDTKHNLPNGDQIDAGHMRSYSVGFAVAYSPTDRLMLSVGAPVTSSAYHGTHPHPTEVDDGTYHTTFTDLRVEAHYQLALEPVALAPYLAYVVPMHHYQTLGHAAPGRELHELWLGLVGGKSLDRYIPRTYLQARLNYALVEKVANISHDKVNFDLELGYFVTPDFSIRTLGQWQDTRGGIPVPIPQSNPLYPYHDRLGAEDFFNLGAGGAWQYSDRSSVYCLYNVGLAGRNGHRLGRGITVGFSHGFRLH
jgi:hypothetical protein